MMLCCSAKRSYRFNKAFYKRIAFAVLVFGTLSCIVLFTNQRWELERAKETAIKKQKWLEEVMPKVKSQFQSDQTNSKDSTIDSQKCKIPRLDPFDHEILPYLKAPILEDCKNKVYGVVEKDVFRMKVEGVFAVYLFYIIRISDFEVQLSEKHILFNGNRQKSRSKYQY